MGSRRDDRGFTLVEVLVAMSILVIGLVAVLAMLSSGSSGVYGGGGYSKAAAYARQQVEQLKNLSFNPGPASGTDTPEAGVTRSWTITPEGATGAPNRLARITVTVTNQMPPPVGSQSVTIETMRAE